MVQFAQGKYEDIGLLSQMAFGVIGIVIGFYLIGWAYHWAESIDRRMKSVRKSVRQGSLAIPFAIVGLVLVIVGILVGYDSSMAYWESLLPSERSISTTILKFVAAAVWFVVFGVFAYESGRSVTATGKIRWSFIVMMISVLATGFIIQGAVDALNVFVGQSDYSLSMVIAEMVTGILIAIFSSVLNASLRTETEQRGASPGA